MRYIIIDNNSGYIWGDSADFAAGKDHGDDLCEVARLLDESLGERGRSYELLGSNPRTTITGYDVYRVDIDGSELLPVVEDGQDQETIDLVESEGEYCGFVVSERIEA